ncbi:MAG TPA: hypothetical protein VFM29_03095 [Vicinamibacteria bacterium]|nr:hypothetical protein [Vicinamibacteria bacterium]
MALSQKVTLASALPTARQHASDLRRATRELGQLPGLEAVGGPLDALERWAGQRLVEADVLLLGPLPEPDAARVAEWLAAGFPAARLAGPNGDPQRFEVQGGAVPMAFQVRPAAARIPQKAGTARAPIAVVIAPPGTPVTDDVSLAVDRALEERPHAVILADPADPAHKEMVQRARATAWTTDAFDVSRLPPTGLQAKLGQPPYEQVLEALRAHSVLGALDSLAAVAGMVVEQQAKETKTKKAMAQQRLARLAQAKPTMGAGELAAEVKARTQRQFVEFERGAADRLQDLLGQPNGSLTRELDARLSGLLVLDEDPKTNHLVTRIPAAFEAELNALVRERIGAHMAADLVAANDLLRMVAQEVERTVAQAGGPPVVVQVQYATEDRARRLLETHAYIQSQYRGELPRPGLGDYFADVRKYSMVLVMAASMFGLSSYLRMYREIVIPITIMLVAFGIVSVAISTRRQRVENQEREVELARNALRPELKRVLTELQKAWSGALSQYLSEQMASVLAQVDAGAKEQGRRLTDANPEKDKIQRQVQALDAADKRLVAAAKTRDAVAAAIPQARTELRALVVSAVTAPAAAASGPGARPAAPGLPVTAVRVPAVPSPPAATAPAAPPVRTAPLLDVADMKAKLAALKARR